MPKKPEMKQDNQPTNQRCPQCGGATLVHQNVAAGQGRVFCAARCGWSDAKSQTTRGPGVDRLSVHQSDPQQRASKGVQILSTNPNTERVTIIDKHR